ncbi:hypothetical protein LEA_01826, partial [human gut metagenome]
MEKYESKHQQILRSAEQIYTVISRFDNLTPAVQDKVEEWQADENSCSFKVKGFTVNLQNRGQGSSQIRQDTERR